MISITTKKNWEKLTVDLEKKLKTRANKSRSEKMVIPTEYFRNEKNVDVVISIVSEIKEQQIDIKLALLSLCMNLMKKYNVKNKYIQDVLEEYLEGQQLIDFLMFTILPDDEYDILGIFYQCLQTEGDKNMKGSYYTPRNITDYMIDELTFENGEILFDPCCGSGAYLLSLKNVKPMQIFGVDRDPIAVMLSKFNLMLKYSNEDFLPQIYCIDYLKLFDSTSMNKLTSTEKKIKRMKFDYIVTNPPWGAKDKRYISDSIKTKESFAHFYINSYEQLRNGGEIRFLFPESILNVKAHRTIREYILENGNLNKITLHDSTFSGVLTRYTDVFVSKKAKEDHVLFIKGDTKEYINKRFFYATENLNFNFVDENAMAVITKIKKNSSFDLSNSKWALGIVTGDNQNKLFLEKGQGLEEIYTGKEVNQFRMQPVKKYIKYERSELQQVAAEEFYRADEKLIYKFISKKLVFSYDNQQKLVLNSANILIPNVSGMSIKTVLAFLNSEVIQYYYQILFDEIKILKSNLLELPLPKITKKTNDEIQLLVDEILNGNDSVFDCLQEIIYCVYRISNKEKIIIQEALYGNIKSANR